MRKLIGWFQRVRANRRWKINVRKNQSRHPRLLQRIKHGENSVVIANRMLVRDRNRLRDEGVSDSDPRFPVLGDYYYMEPLSHSLWPFEGLRRLWWLLFEGSLV